MSSPFVSVEKQKLGAILAEFKKIPKPEDRMSLAEKGENLPATIRQLGICHSLMKYYNKKERRIYTLLVREIREFDPQIFKNEDGKEEVDPIPRIFKLNALSVQAEIMLFEHLMSFAEEFRRVAKVFIAKKNEASKSN